MPAKLQLGDKEVSYSEVKEDESNVLAKFAVWDRRNSFFSHLDRHRARIQATVAHHLGLNVRECHMAEYDDWLYGSFNLCIPVSISSWKTKPTKRVIMRFPLPYKLGGLENADEKLRCEAGTYIWLQQNCPSVPIPRLHGVGFSTGQKLTAIDNLPLFHRLALHLYRRLLTWLKFPVPSRYVPHQRASLGSLGSGYLLIDYIEKNQGQMLSSTWNEERHNNEIRENLFRGLSRILLDITRVPLQRIGSFTVDNNGFLLLANRPLSMIIHQLENEKIPVDIPRQLTYTSADSYVADMLNCVHDSRLRHQPNGASDEADCVFQMSALAAMRALSPIFLRRDLCRGPFFLKLNDLHQSNIFVDDNWNFTCLVDLEWAFSCPVEMIQPPHWLANQTTGKLDDKIYDPLRREFVDILERSEQELAIQPQQRLSSAMKQAWETGAFWYVAALDNVWAFTSVFYEHIQPMLARDHKENNDFHFVMMEHWTIEPFPFVRKKLADKEDYDRQLREAFEDKADGDVKETC